LDAFFEPLFIYHLTEGAEPPRKKPAAAVKKEESSSDDNDEDTDTGSHHSPDNSGDDDHQILWTDPNLVKLPETTLSVFDDHVIPLALYLKGTY
jgi:hypothetical protein